MNKNALKTYAPRARRDFIAAVTARAAKFGVSPTKVEPARVEGDFVIIGGTPFPRKVAEQRRLLEGRINVHGFAQVMEEAAYTWFNRFAAIRFMEIHGYLDHGYRVLSHPAGKSTPEIVEQADHVDLPGLQRDKVVELKLAGRKDEDLYQMLLIAQCNALHAAMPFLFERIDDETELLLPDNLLHTDSLIRQMVAEIDENNWKEIEIIGWLYQFYIAERKDEVIGKVVKSEDIPAATQLFTPSWIVKYMVQNTLGAKWIATYPNSPLKAKMEYYITPAKQTDEVNRRLAEITPAELDPETLTMIDPACGSGHILVEGYDLLKEIYLERGYTLREIPRLILEKNLFGLDIDDRAAQLAGFALMMKARADDRSILAPEDPPHFNIMAIQETNGLDVREVVASLNPPTNKADVPKPYLFEEIEEAENPLFSKRTLAKKADASQDDIGPLLDLFVNAKTFGSLIQVQPQLATALPEIERRLNNVLEHGDLTHASAHVIKPLLQQARLLARQYDAVVANPPYMGSNYFSPTLKKFVGQNYKSAKADLYSCFLQRNSAFAAANGFAGMITIPNWMFLSSFESMRKELFEQHIIETFIHNGRGIFGSDFGSCTFALRKMHLPDYRGTYRRLFDKQGSVSSIATLRDRFFSATNYSPRNADFSTIPGSPVAFSVSDAMRQAFQKFPKLGDRAKKGLSTGENPLFIRFWHEIDEKRFSIRGGNCWYPVSKGGPFRKWFGNCDSVIDWRNDGERLRSFTDAEGTPRSAIRNSGFYFNSGISWNDVTISSFSARYVPDGFIPTDSGPLVYGEPIKVRLAALNSKAIGAIATLLSPTCHFSVGIVSLFPVPVLDVGGCASIADDAINLARADWDSFETSWDFQTSPLLQSKGNTLLRSHEAALSEYVSRFARMKQLEEQNNRLFIGAYGLQNELVPEVSDDQITLAKPDQQEQIKRLLSYAVGCMMGRYSLDQGGLIYARSGNEGFDTGQYKTFAADDDGIIPVLDTDWGMRDDIANRMLEFISVAWPKESLELNLKFIADSLGAKSDETPSDTIRRHLSRDFFKDHLQTYKRRPIYWLFSSGKEKGFECLVYLHRYNAGTLSRMRMDYVVPLQGRVRGKVEQFETAIKDAPSAAAQTKIRKQLEKLKRKQAELVKFDEELRHFADLRVELDLDDGVKVNYAKFGNLLAEVKKISGDPDE